MVVRLSRMFTRGRRQSTLFALTALLILGSGLGLLLAGLTMGWVVGALGILSSAFAAYMVAADRPRTSARATAPR